MTHSLTIIALLVFSPLIFVLRPIHVAAQDGINNDETMILYDFSGPNDIESWRIVNDGVMGGLSRGEIISGTDKTAVFRGILSLDNNGGFSSTRTKPRSFELGDYDALEIRIKGDGRPYQFRTRTDNRVDGIAYRLVFTTTDSEWLTIQLPFKDFVAVFRGRQIMDAPPLAAEKIRQVGFLIADQQAGPFRLEIDWIKAIRSR